MKYLRFTVRNYKAIRGPLVVNLERFPLLPLIGLNESGKTSVLEAALAFDSYSDEQNNGRHLKDLLDLTDPGSNEEPQVTAELEVPTDQLISHIHKLRGAAEAKSQTSEAEELATLAQHVADTQVDRVEVARTLSSDGDHSYHFPAWTERLSIANHEDLAEEIVSTLPHVLFFDDFRARRDHVIPLVADEESREWTKIIQQLFNKAGCGVKLEELPNDPRTRDTLLGRAEAFLNQRIADEWAAFHLEKGPEGQIRLRLRYIDQPRPSIRIDVVEQTERGSVVFNISDRSKGFFWFFNFVMKLEFNPKAVGTASQRAVFLLDEPGSF
ncbi:MAG: hypothetical protein AAF411_14830, partial [Myxococcota bacterium]